MMSLELPVVAPGTTIEESLQAMKRTDRSAVVVAMVGGAAIVVTLGEMLDVLNHVAETKKLAGSLAIGDLFQVAPSSKVPRAIIDQLRALQDGVSVDQSDLRGRLDEFGSPIVILRVRAGRASVLTASDDYGSRLMSMPSVCTCAGRPSHSFRLDEVDVPGVCNFPHASPLTCI